MGGHERPGRHPGHNDNPAKNAGEISLKDRGFYQSAAWRRARRLALQRDKYLCRLKLDDRCSRIATEVHHLRPLESAPELALDLGNLVSCCWRCHELTKRRGNKENDTPAGVRVIRISGEGDRE